MELARIAGLTDDDDGNASHALGNLLGQFHGFFQIGAAIAGNIL